MLEIKEIAETIKPDRSNAVAILKFSQLAAYRSYKSVNTEFSRKSLQVRSEISDTISAGAQNTYPGCFTYLLHVFFK